VKRAAGQREQKEAHSCDKISISHEKKGGGTNCKAGYRFVTAGPPARFFCFDWASRHFSMLNVVAELLEIIRQKYRQEEGVVASCLVLHCWSCI
jgi:hypothetical protein